MHGPINVKSLNNINKWQMGFNSAFKGLMELESGMKCMEKETKALKTKESFRVE
jgi:hypothetical protein